MSYRRSAFRKGSPKNVIVIPTRDRWRAPDGSPGCAHAALMSCQSALRRDGLQEETMILVVDASGKEQRTALDDILAADQAVFKRGATTLILDSASMHALAEDVRDRIDVSSEVLHALLVHPFYGSQRLKADLVVGAMAVLDGAKRQLAIDDDVLIPSWRHAFRVELLRS